MENSIFLHLNAFVEHDHVCHIYENDSECFEIAANYFIHGIKAGKTCVYISDRPAPPELLKRLEGHGVRHGGKGKAFEEVILGNFLKEPRRPDMFVSHVEKSLEKATKKGGRPVRVLMTLSTDPFFSLTPSERIWIKASLNKMTLEKPVIMLTQHNVERISSRELLAIFRTHPTIVERGTVYKSPFYRVPGELMKEGENELDKFGMLSGKEKKVLGLITSGLSNSAIAKELSISIKTVETHRANIMKKLDIHNLVDLVKYSMRKGLG